MSSGNARPDDDLLLRAALGELSEEEATRLAQCLAECPDGDLVAAEYRQSLQEFKEFYQGEFQQSVPEPPHAWRGFYGKLAAQRQHPFTLGARLRAVWGGWTHQPSLAWVAAVTCMVVAALLIGTRLNHAPRVSAHEVLERAAAAEEQAEEALHVFSGAVVCQTLEVRVGARRLTRTVYRDVARHRQVDRWSARDGGPLRQDAQPPLATELAGRFKSARLNWSDPLSPVSIQTWLGGRAKLDQAQETVREEDGVYTITLRTPASAPAPQNVVTETDFVVRMTDYHPVAARFQFSSDADEVDLTETRYEIHPVQSLEASVRSELDAPLAHQPAGAVKEPATVASEPDTTPESIENVEIRALYALHQRRADLGGETEVKRTADGVTVSGVVVSRRRKQELVAALRLIPGIRTDIETAEQAAARQTGTTTTAPQSAAAIELPALEKALVENFPEQGARDAFVLETIECSQQALVRGFALQRLLRTAPARGGTALSPEVRREWREMATEHRRDMETQLDRLFDRMTPLAGAVTAQPDRIPRAASWAETEAEVTRDLQALDKLVTRLMSASAGPVEERDPATLIRQYQDLGSRIRARIARLREEPDEHN